MKSRSQVFIFICMIVSLVFVVSCGNKQVVTDTKNMTKTDDAGTKDKKVDTASKPIEDVAAKKDDAAKLAADENKAGAKESKAVRMEAGNDVFFDYDSSAIQNSQFEAIKKETEWLIANPKKSITIEGHCDERGTEEYNIALGDRRAAAVKSCLEKMGITGNRMTTVSFGKEKPMVNEHNERAWAKNRRAHFDIQ